MTAHATGNDRPDPERPGTLAVDTQRMEELVGALCETVFGPDDTGGHGRKLRLEWRPPPSRQVVGTRSRSDLLVECEITGETFVVRGAETVPVLALDIVDGTGYTDLTTAHVVHPSLADEPEVLLRTYARHLEEQLAHTVAEMSSVLCRIQALQDADGSVEAQAPVEAK